MKRRVLIILLVVSVIGLAISGFSLAHHDSFVSGKFCTIGQTFNCDVVNKGAYSTIGGVPVALIGVIGYALLVIASALKIRQPNDKGLTLFLVASALGGLGFSAYLTSLEAFVLHAWCLLCLTSQIVILTIFASVAWLWYTEHITNKVRSV